MVVVSPLFRRDSYGGGFTSFSLLPACSFHGNCSGVWMSTRTAKKDTGCGRGWVFYFPFPGMGLQLRVSQLSSLPVPPAVAVSKAGPPANHNSPVPFS